MNSLKLYAPAKINLCIDILGKRPDGYHDVRMIMQSINLYDVITVDITKGNGIEVSCNVPYVPCNNTNIAYKAAELIINKYNISSGIKIDIDKNIPVAAGLGGGSSNAASVIKALNELFSLNMSKSDMASIGCKIGADVPFFIYGGTMLAEGIGDKLSLIENSIKLNIVLVKPAINIFTQWVYKNLNLNDILLSNTDLIVECIIKNDIIMLASNMKNDLESVTQNAYPIIGEIKNRLIKLGALGSLMSGSGSSVFGIFENFELAKLAYENISRDYKQSFLLESI